MTASGNPFYETGGWCGPEAQERIFTLSRPAARRGRAWNVQVRGVGHRAAGRRGCRASLGKPLRIGRIIRCLAFLSPRPSWSSPHQSPFSGGFRVSQRITRLSARSLDAARCSRSHRHEFRGTVGGVAGPWRCTRPRRSPEDDDRRASCCGGCRRPVRAAPSLSAQRTGCRLLLS